MTKSLRALGMTLFLGIAAVGCNRQPQVTAYDTPKEAEQPEAAPAQPVAMAAQAETREGITSYDAPKSWVLDSTPHMMREMTFDIDKGGKAATVIVSRFPSITFTNDPLNNINRWRGQVGMQPVKAMSEQESAKVKVGSDEATVYDLTGPQARLIVAMVPRGDEIWYIKLIGNADTITAEKKGFETFLGSLKFGEVTAQGGGVAAQGPLPAGHPAIPGQNPAMPAGHPPVNGGADASQAGATPAMPAGIDDYLSPADWKRDPTPRAMRELTFNIGQGDDAATVIVSRLPAMSFTNNPLSNINRWRAQVDLAPAKEMSDQPVEKLKVGGDDAMLYDMSGPDGKRQIVALVTRGNDIWYFKVIGNGKTVGAEKSHFQAFLGSVKFAAGK